jgi:hypothetical protein
MSHLVDAYGEQGTIYNNIGTFDNKQGRLTVGYKAGSISQINWEFETLSSYVDNFGIFSDRDRMSNLSIKGKGLKFGTVRVDSLGSSVVRGFVSHVRLNDTKRSCQDWRLYFVNLRCDMKNSSGNRANYVREGSERSARILHTETECDYKKGFKVILSTPNSLIKDAKSGSIDEFTFTSVIQIYDPNLKRGISSKEILKISKCITFMMRFASGGYTYPLSIEGFQVKDGMVSDKTHIYSTGKVSRMSEFSDTWFSDSSDMGLYLSNIPKLMNLYYKQSLETDLEVCLLWYIQSLQASEIPVVANALGAGIEKLSYLFLVKANGFLSEDDWQRKNSLDARIFELCNHLSIRELVNIRAVKDFVDVRNESTHAKKRVGGKIDQSRAIREVILIFEEAMLSLIGYKGSYYNRCNGKTTVSPRYQIH